MLPPSLLARWIDEDHGGEVLDAYIIDALKRDGEHRKTERDRPRIHIDPERSERSERSEQPDPPVRDDADEDEDTPPAEEETTIRIDL
ncbi:MAG: hypothetical protein ACFB9M_19860 [Myxococcota bacterium]